MSSDDEEGVHRQREFQTSFEEDTARTPQQTSLGATASPGVLSQITGQAGDDSDKMDISSPYCECVILVEILAMVVFLQPPLE